MPLLVPAVDTRKSPLTVSSCCEAESVLRTYAFEPDVADSDSCADTAPARTTALWTTAAPSPAVWTWLQAEKSPDSKPSAKSEEALAGPARTRRVRPVRAEVARSAAARRLGTGRWRSTTRVRHPDVRPFGDRAQRHESPD